jgi:hypothetical protein
MSSKLSGMKLDTTTKHFTKNTLKRVSNKRPKRSSALDAQNKWRKQKSFNVKLDKELKEDMGTSSDVFTKKGEYRVEFFGFNTREELDFYLYGKN